MRTFNLFLIFILISASYISSFGQSCDASVSGLANWSALSWGCSGGGTAPVVDGNTYVEDITVNGLGTGDILTMDVSITIDGDLNINASGSDPAFTIPAGVTLIITGDLNSDNNNVLYTINGTLQVDGTFTVKNGNQFAGNGTLKGGSLVVKNSNTCAGTCPTITFSSCCEDGGTNCFPPGTPASFCTNNNPAGLPVELLYFDAEVSQSNVLLKWATTQEINNKHFIIQRSRDLKSWQAIDTIKGNGNHKGILYYGTTDQPPGNSLFYYRLKQVDFDGTSAYSPIEGVKIVSNNPPLLVFPNPTDKQIINVQLNGISGKVFLQLTDMFGKKVWEEVEELTTGAYLLRQVSIEDFSAGIYILKASTETQAWQQKVVIK